MVQDTVLLIRHKASQNRVWFPFHSSYSFLTKQSLPSALGPKHPNNNNQKNPPKNSKKKPQPDIRSESKSTKGKSVLKPIRWRKADSIKFIAWFQDLGRASSFPVPPEYLLCLLWAKTSRVILMSCSKHFCIVNHRFLSPSPNQYKDIYAEHIKALDTIEKTIIPCKTFAFGRWHHGIIHYTLHMPAIYRKAEWPCLPAVHIRAARGSKATDSHLCLRTANRGSWEKPCKQKQLSCLPCSCVPPRRRLLSQTGCWPDTSFFQPRQICCPLQPWGRPENFISSRCLPALQGLCQLGPSASYHPYPGGVQRQFKPQGRDAEAPASSCCTDLTEHTMVPFVLAIPLSINTAPFLDAGRALGTKAQHTWTVPTPMSLLRGSWEVADTSPCILAKLQQTCQVWAAYIHDSPTSLALSSSSSSNSHLSSKALTVCAPRKGPTAKGPWEVQSPQPQKAHPALHQTAAPEEQACWTVAHSRAVHLLQHCSPTLPFSLQVMV